MVAPCQLVLFLEKQQYFYAGTSPNDKRFASNIAVMKYQINRFVFALKENFGVFKFSGLTPGLLTTVWFIEGGFVFVVAPPCIEV